MIYKLQSASMLRLNNLLGTVCKHATLQRFTKYSLLSCLGSMTYNIYFANIDRYDNLKDKVCFHARMP